MFRRHVFASIFMFAVVAGTGGGYLGYRHHVKTVAAEKVAAHDKMMERVMSRIRGKVCHYDPALRRIPPPHIDVWDTRYSVNQD